jgi:mono/diheme cytochrome c family protein
MNEKDKKEYLEEYEQEKKNGVGFYPNVIFKDVFVSFIIFIILIGLAYFIGAPLEERANPADSNYTPKPEWYFLFLFQLLKYFPGSIEFVGVVIIPTLAIILLFLLPFMDRSKKRHFLDRPIIMAAVGLSVIGILFLSFQSVLEAPPPSELGSGDETAVLYLENCAGCHGSSISVAVGTNLHDIISQGKHEGMPSWSADLSTDQIDALAGFILSPGGSRLFTDNCGDCHDVNEMIAGDPIELRNAIDDGIDYPPHSDLEIIPWSETLIAENRTDLLNFLVAPDGQRLYTVNCASCHGQAIVFAGDETELIEIISQGGLHLEMPPWQEDLNPSDIDILTRFVLDPVSNAEGQQLFDSYCSACHGEQIPMGEEFNQTRDLIRYGGAHQTMPVWGESLTEDQLEALVSYTLNLSSGTLLEGGQNLYVSNCATCHGDFGEGGPNPSRSDDIIAPISTAEYLATRDDFSLRAIISQGQPNFGMSPFGSSFGGPLDDDQIDAIVAYIRSWQAKPPVELPPEVSVPPSESLIRSEDLFASLCAQCHGAMGEGGFGPSLIDPEFTATNSDQEIFDHIDLGHEATAMIAWGEILSSEQITQLVEFIRGLEQDAENTTDEHTTDVPSFTADVLPIFEQKCNMCHGTLGGWDGTTYMKAITTGNHAPVIIPGDIENSILAQKILGTQTIGTIMPPRGLLPENEIQIILNWIEAGAPE